MRKTAAMIPLLLAICSVGGASGCGQEDLDVGNVDALEQGLLAGWVSGYVRLSSGAGLSGATVSEGTTALTKTLAGGAYVLALRPGSHTLTARKTGYQAKSKSLYVPESESISYSFSLTAVGRAVIQSFVARFYLHYLQRNPDAASETWVNTLLAGTNSGGDIGRGIGLSPECAQKNYSDGEFIKRTYRAFFNREADPAGYNGWMNYLNSGGTRSGLLDGFIFSPEFLQLADGYGIRPY